ncbi:MAG: hypothetical protein SGBAC_004820 [Bacillariaceae sp.]
MIRQLSLVTARNSFVRTACRRFLSSDYSGYYHIEVSNAHSPSMTQLTVSGPDVDGILASMTVALAIQGCSLVELYASKNTDCSVSRSTGTESNNIKDVFLVVDRITGQQFGDDELHPLAVSLLESLKTPINTLSMTGAKDALKEIEQNLDGAIEATSADDQITVLPSTATVSEAV